MASMKTFCLCLSYRSVALSNRRRTRLSHFSVLWVNTWLVLTLLQGDGLAPAMLLFALQAAFTINFIALLPNGKHKSRTGKPNSPHHRRRNRGVGTGGGGWRDATPSLTVGIEIFCATNLL